MGTEPINNEIKYLKIAELIKRKILNHIYNPNDSLPSENSLCEEYSVSRMTIRKSIETLIKEGYLYSSPGKGTFVKEYSTNKYNIDFSVKDVINGGFTEAKCIKAGIINPTIDLVYKLGVSPKEKIVDMVWMLYQQDEAVALNEKFLVYFPGMNFEENSFVFNDMINIVAHDNYIFGFSEEVDIQGIYPNEDLQKYLLDIEQPVGFMVMFERLLKDSDYIAVGYEKLFVRCEKCTVRGTSFF